MKLTILSFPLQVDCSDGDYSTSSSPIQAYIDMNMYINHGKQQSSTTPADVDDNNDDDGGGGGHYRRRLTDWSKQEKVCQ